MRQGPESALVAAARERIVIFDGGMGTALGTETGAALCPEQLNEVRPDAVRQAHAAFLSAGADVIETNSFGGAAHTLAEFGLADRCFELNRKAAEIARSATREFSLPARPRWVAGSIGPGSRLPSLGQVRFSDLVASFRPQVDGLLSGGSDCLIVETCQDLLQLKAALVAIGVAFEALGRRVPVIAQVTLDAHGRMLVGTDIAAALAAIEPLAVAAIGLNCGLGPEGMAAAVHYLGRNSSRLLSVMPNAGLPRLVAGRAGYDIGPEGFAAQMKQFALDPGLNFAGGCCGTTPEHIRALAGALAGIPARRPAKPVARVSSLFSAQALAVEPRPLICGERTNATGSKRFRDLLVARDFDGMVRRAREQKEEGAHLIDLSVAAAGKDERADMTELCRRLNTEVDTPVMIDTTDPETVAAALEHLGGRSIVNSANLDDPERTRRIVALCRQYGAALVLMAIDARGMAQTAERKLDVAERLFDLAVRRGGLAPDSVFFDFLTFTLGSGDESLRPAAKETLAAIKAAKQRFPASFTLLGVSNVSYGLPPAARKALNTVFLERAVEHGLDAAILHAGRIQPLTALDPATIALCDDLVFDRDRDALSRLLDRFSGTKQERIVVPAAGLDPADRLRNAVMTGDAGAAVEATTALIATRKALAIVDDVLLPTMAEVGRQFAAGRLHLPFVLRSAEAMRAALNRLQPELGAAGAKPRGTLVIATVRGDIHDIGKNLVEMILVGNGFAVVNLGVRRTPEEIVAAVREHKPDAVGLSGLLVESARSMKDYLTALAASGFSLPVICGGAALERGYVEGELQAAYPGRVCYAPDAMAGLAIMQSIVEGGRDASATVITSPVGAGQERKPRPRARRTVAKPTGKPPATRVVRVPLSVIVPRLDRDALFRKRWQLWRGRAPARAAAEAGKLMDGLLRSYTRRGVFRCAVAWCAFKARIDGEDVVCVHPETGAELARLCFSPLFRQRMARRFGTKPFPVAVQVVTIGQKVVDAGRSLAEAGKMHDSFLLHGLAAEITEALAEYSQLHIARLRGHKTVRYSPGYPVWPRLTEQRKLFGIVSAGRIKVTLTEICQMVPEYSTSAIIVPEPQAGT